MTRNLILKQLSEPTLDKFLNVSNEIQFMFRESLIESNREVDKVYFPETCVASIVTPIEDNKLIEAATIGREGFVGLPAFLGTNVCPETAFCQIEGRALSIKASDFTELVSSSEEFRRLCNYHVAVVNHQIARNLGCNAAHTIQQRCARWLLLSHDRVEGDQFYLTQETLAIMLGVSRTGVNIAAGALQDAGLITYVRGKISIINRFGLEKMTCNCYKSITDFRKLFFKDVEDEN